MILVNSQPRFWLELKAIDDVTLSGNASIRGYFVRFDDALLTSSSYHASAHSRLLSKHRQGSE